MTSYFPLGTFPRDDVEGAARLLVRYRAAKLTGPEFGEMFVLSVDEPDAVVARADAIEERRRRLLARMQSEADVPNLVVPPGEEAPEHDFGAHIATVQRMRAADPDKEITQVDLTIYREELAKVKAKKGNDE